MNPLVQQSREHEILYSIVAGIFLAPLLALKVAHGLTAWMVEVGVLVPNGLVSIATVNGTSVGLDLRRLVGCVLLCCAVAIVAWIVLQRRNVE